jgi:predicted transposase YbfD/YdcC
MDAMGCQKDIVKQIVAKKGDYFIGLKGNQGSLYEDVKLFYQEKGDKVQFNSYNNTDFGHGRIQERSCIATNDIKWLQMRYPEWQNLQTIAQIKAKITNKKTNKESIETRYYITSLAPNAAKNMYVSQAHWEIENNLHWCLDVIWKEDQSQIKYKNAATNFATVRKIAYNILKLNEDKIPLKRKRLKATLSNEFISKLLTS